MKRKNRLAGLVALLVLLAMALPGSASESDASIAFLPGELQLVEAPNLRFGSHKLEGRTVEYAPEQIEGNLLVIDGRGTLSGWALQAQLSPFVDAKKSQQEMLAGSSLVLEPAIPSTYRGIPLAPKPSYLAKNLELVAGDAVSHTVCRAETGEGNGGWDLNVNQDTVRLRVPGQTATPGDYTATIYWTLSDAPAI